MIRLPQVTLISLAAINLDPVIEAMLESQRGIQFGDSVLVSPSPPRRVPKSIRWEMCPPLRLRSPGVDDYSHYFLYNMWRHVQTEKCLVVQADGYVLDARRWSSDFLEYDYIGAPWRKRRTAYVDPFGKQQRVGNGGFSFRSSKLLQVPQSRHVPFDVNSGTFYQHMNANLLHEDGNICVHNRHIYEDAGCVFAPVNVAVRFSQEHFVPEARWVKPFGFHRLQPRLIRNFFP